MFLIFGGTNRGKKRALNQDAFRFGKSGENAWILVCDGLGGENAGEVASEAAVEAAAEAIKQGLGKVTSQQKAKKLTIDAVKAANEAVINKAKGKPKFEGMSTTIVCVIIYDGMLHVANVGDSRAYTVLEGQVKQLTKDHSIVQVLLDSGKISQEQAKKHPDKNCLVKVLGLQSDVLPSYLCQDFLDGTKVVVCTDGLYNCLTKEDISSVTGSFAAQELPEQFINLALKRGGADNITVVVAEKSELQAGG